MMQRYVSYLLVIANWQSLDCTVIAIPNHICHHYYFIFVMIFYEYSSKINFSSFICLAAADWILARVYRNAALWLYKTWKFTIFYVNLVFYKMFVIIIIYKAYINFCFLKNFIFNVIISYFVIYLLDEIKKL